MKFSLAVSNKRVPIVSRDVTLVTWLFVIASTFMLTATASTTTDEGLFKTDASVAVNVSVPVHLNISSIFFWTDQEDTHLSLKLYPTYIYAHKINVTKIGVWHIAYLKQPNPKSNFSYFNLPSLNINWKLNVQRIDKLSLSSNNEVHWMVCLDNYSCVRHLPRGVTEEYSQANDLFFNLFIGVASLCLVLLLTALLTPLVLFLYKRRAEHVYEKPFFPPVPPPLPESFSNPCLEKDIGNKEEVKSQQNDTSRNYGKNFYDDIPEIQVCRNSTLVEVTDNPKAVILDYESVNSIYGLAIQ